jgi:hypothetical protein
VLRAALIVIAILLVSAWTSGFRAQCTYNNTFYTVLSPPCPGTEVAPCVLGGEYVTVNVTAGNVYTFSTCSTPSFDSQITLFNANGTLFLGYNDDACGLQSSVSWTATYTGQVQVLVDQYFCSNAAVCIDLTVTCSNGAAEDCGYDNLIVNTVMPPCPGQLDYGCLFAGEALDVEVVAGNTYTFSTCNSPTFNSVLTLYDQFGISVLASNDDACGFQSEIVWIATYSGIVTLLLDEFPCSSNLTCMDVTITCEAAIGGGDGCNTNTVLCQNNAGPFGFGAAGNPVSSCLDWLATSQFAYILVNITSTGPLNLLIQGDGATGFLDVSVFNVPSGVDPCAAIQNLSNEIGCNYATFSSGCNQFGSSYPCLSSVPSPIVTAGQTIMIVVEDWMNGSSNNFNLQLGPPPNAQSGPPNPTITTVGPFCLNAAQIQLNAIDMGGTWTGPGVSSEGLFNPALAGIGTHFIGYSIGQPPCTASSNTAIDVLTAPEAEIVASDSFICPGQSVVLTASGGGSYTWNTGATSPSITVSPTTSAVYTVNVTLPGGCNATSGEFIVVTPQPVTSIITAN